MGSIDQNQLATLDFLGGSDLKVGLASYHQAQNRFRENFHNLCFIAKMFHLAKKQNQIFIIFEKHCEKVDFEL